LEYNIKTVKKEDIVAINPIKASKWCALPYPRHKAGCPNYNICKNSERHKKRFEDLFDNTKPMYLTWVEFDVEEQEKNMKKRHKTWSRAQCRNLLYWQKKVDNTLFMDAYKIVEIKNLKHYQMLGEGYGLNMYKICNNVGLKLEPIKNIKIVRKVLLLVKRKGKTEKEKIQHLPKNKKEVKI